MKAQIYLKSYCTGVNKNINKIMDPITIKQVSLEDWIIIIEKKDLGILFTCIRKKPRFTLYLELYHLPQNMIILFDTLEDLWGYLKFTDRYVMEGNTLKVAFTFGIHEKQISFHMDGNQCQLIENIYRLQEEIRTIPLRYQHEIVQLREDNRRKDNAMQDLQQQVASLQMQKRKYEESLNRKSIFNQYLMSAKSQSHPQSHPFAFSNFGNDIFKIQKDKKFQLPDIKNFIGFWFGEEQKKQRLPQGIKKKDQGDELSIFAGMKQPLARQQTKCKKKEKRQIRIQ